MYRCSICGETWDTWRGLLVSGLHAPRRIAGWRRAARGPAEVAGCPACAPEGAWEFVRPEHAEVIVDSPLAAVEARFWRVTDIPGEASDFIHPERYFLVQLVLLAKNYYGGSRVIEEVLGMYTVDIQYTVECFRLRHRGILNAEDAFNAICTSLVEG